MITLFGSSAYPERLAKLVGSLDRSVDFEIVVCGPKKFANEINNIEGIPFRYIHSEFKPLQCSMIAAKNSSGEFLCHIVDDIHFVKPSGLFELVKEHQRVSSKTSRPVFSSTRLKRSGEEWKDSNYYLYDDPNMVIPISIFCDRSLFFRLGGYDSSFIYAMADADLIRRGRQTVNAHFYLSSVAVEETKEVRSVSLFDIYGQKDIQTLINKSRGVDKSRFFQLEYLEVKQFGPAGIWTFQSAVIRWFWKKYFYFYLRIRAKWKSILTI